MCRQLWEHAAGLDTLIHQNQGGPVTSPTIDISVLW